MIEKLQGAGAEVADKLHIWPQLYEALGSREAIADFLNCDIEEVPPEPPSHLSTLQMAQELESAQDFTSEFPEAPPDLDPQAAEILEAVQKLQAAQFKYRLEVESATVDIYETKPFAVCFPGDFHIGSAGTIHASVMALMQLIHDVDGLYCIINGDIINNYISKTYDEERHSQPIGPGIQKDIARALMEWIAPKCLALTAGQHEYWSVRQDDFDAGKYFAKHAEAAYLGPGGEVILECESTTYMFGVWHRYRGSSIYDPLAAAKRCYWDHGASRWDVTAVADLHEPAIAKQIMHRQERVFVRCGTAKLIDAYAKKLGYTSQRFYIPIVVLDPYTRKLEVFLKLSTALGFLQYLRMGGKW